MQTHEHDREAKSHMTKSKQNFCGTKLILHIISMSNKKADVNIKNEDTKLPVWWQPN